MFKKILVSLDGTPEAAVALPVAQALAQGTSAEVGLIRVVTHWLTAPDRREDEEAWRYVDRVAAELRQGDLVVNTAVRLGETPAEILREQRIWGADLVVMATHGRSGLGRAIVGSVAERVLAESPVPVIVVRPGGHRTSEVKTLLVPVDGEPGGALALGVAVGLSKAIGARIVLLEVTTPIPMYVYASMGTGFGGYVDPAWDEQAADSARHYVEGLAERLKAAGVDAEGIASLGDVVPEITTRAAAIGADLIVMSTHALTGPARALLGSVADAVVRHTDRPVLLIRQSVAAPNPSGSSTPAAARASV